MNFVFFSKNIWSIQKKAVPLHPVSKTKLDILKWCGSSVG